MTIKTSRLLLRKHQLQDYDRFWAMLNDPVAKRYTGGVTRLSYEQRLEVYKEDCETPFTERQTEFAIIEKDTGIYLGYCGVMPARKIAGVEFFYGLCRDSWGKGYGFEAAKAALAYFCLHLKHERYAAAVDSENVASARLLRKLGFRETGRLPDAESGAIVCFEIRPADFLSSFGLSV